MNYTGIAGGIHDRGIGWKKRDPLNRVPAAVATATAAAATAGAASAAAATAATTVPHPICSVCSKHWPPTFTSFPSDRFSDRSCPSPPERQTPLGLYTTRPLHTRWRRSTGLNSVLYNEAWSHLAITSMFGRVALRHTSWERGGGAREGGEG